MKTSYKALAIVMVGATVILTAIAHIGGSRPPVTAPSRMGAAIERPATLVAGQDADLARPPASCETCIGPADLAADVAFAGPRNPGPLVAAGGRSVRRGPAGRTL